ncbi:MAG: acetyl-CoA C-acetyltransferase [Rhodospirillaceae bacterium]|nr:acetyl-CoA C-acetyltransferase [Rhodospirillaceae bacterium]
MPDAFIYDHVRSPRGRGRPNGSLHTVTPTELMTQVLKGVRDRSQLDTALVDDVILGCVAPHEEQGANIARVSAINADYDQSVPGVQINRFCASGLEAVNMGAAKVMAGASELIVSGGVESMSRVAMGSDRGAWANDPRVAFHTYFTPQGIGADMIATQEGFTRTDVDTYAMESQQLAGAAWKDGRFKNSVLPIKDQLGLTLLDHDEHMRPNTTVESLAGLKAAFAGIGDKVGFDSILIQRYPEVEAINHVHHGGNSSGIVDGAAAVLIGNKDVGKAIGKKPRARIRAFASIGSEPSIMLTGPSFAAEKVLKKAGMKASDIDLWELNEAFASVVMLFMRRMNVSRDRINVNGGAIAMGHPLGATGAIITGTVLDELERRGLSTALIVLCVGAGMGTATIIERI